MKVKTLSPTREQRSRTLSSSTSIDRIVSSDDIAVAMEEAKDAMNRLMSLVKGQKLGSSQGVSLFSEKLASANQVFVQIANGDDPMDTDLSTSTHSNALALTERTVRLGNFVPTPPRRAWKRLRLERYS
ncbi:MAG: hypothetical protein CMI56_00850, partial [Parcubacteria group bacterium]|nr:hypothetical protein [Parcubacteria group bacterium]